MKNNWKEKVKDDIKSQIREEADRNTSNKYKRKKEFYKNLYSRTKKYEFPPKDKINLNKHFFFPKSVVSEYNLSKIALAVYPVMCLKADFINDTLFQINQEEIAIKSGLSTSTVHKASLELEDKKLLSRRIQNSGKKHYYVYKISFIRKDMIEEYSNQYFTFNQSIIDTGTWANLSLRSKALYLVLRAKAINDIEYLFYDEEIFDGSRIDYDDLIKTYLKEYRSRKFDICIEPISELCNIVGINSSNMKPVIEQLKMSGLISDFDCCYEVYLKPNI